MPQLLRFAAAKMDSEIRAFDNEKIVGTGVFEAVASTGDGVMRWYAILARKTKEDE